MRNFIVTVQDSTTGEVLSVCTANQVHQCADLGTYKVQYTANHEVFETEVFHYVDDPVGLLANKCLNEFRLEGRFDVGPPKKYNPDEDTTVEDMS